MLAKMTTAERRRWFWQGGSKKRVRPRNESPDKKRKRRSEYQRKYYQKNIEKIRARNRLAGKRARAEKKRQELEER